MEQMKNHKAQKFRAVFIKHTVSFCVMTLVLIASIIGLFLIGIVTGFILPANYAETQISEVKAEIIKADEISTDMIPALCEYAVFSPEGAYLHGSLNSTAAVDAWNVVTDNAMGTGYQYAVIERENEVCLLRYVIKAAFSPVMLRKIFPDVEILMILLFIICFLTGAAIIAFRFGKLLTVKMQGLQEAAVKIQQQDLDFSIQLSGIYEIDNVLCSLDKMKDALKDSLQQQWNLEQARKEQISALAHDIKTPVTIIRGNAELLRETAQNEIQKEFTQYIFNNANQVEKYIKQLINISKMQDRFYIEFNWIDTTIFLQGIENQMKALAMTKNMKAQMELHNVPERLYVDKELFTRAMINVLDNAVEHTPDGGEIVFTVEADSETIRFQISDSGAGFSEADINKVTKQFYMSDKSRAMGNHYGMGLFITESIVRQHEGMLIIKNNPITGGGQVSIHLPLECFD